MSFLLNPYDLKFGYNLPSEGAVGSLGRGDGLAPTAPNIPTGAGTGLGFNIGTGQLALAGLNTIGNLWGAFQSMKMAKDQLKFTKQTTRTNLANQIQSYNTALADRARSRGFVEGQTPGQIQAYFDSNALKQLPGRDTGGFGGGSYAASTGSPSTVDSTASGLRRFSRPARNDENPGG